MSQFRAGTRPGERTSASIEDVKDDELDALFPLPTKIPRCKAHWRLKGSAAGGVVTGCAGCREEAEALQAIAQRRDRVPRTLAKKSRSWHAAGGGTEQFSLAAYDRLMSEAR